MGMMVQKFVEDLPDLSNLGILNNFIGEKN
jgi:hypothetical protein